MKSLITFVIFDISLSSQAVGFSTLTFVSALLCFVARTEDATTFAPTKVAKVLNPPPHGESSLTLSLPAFCLASGGVYGVNSVCLNALNFSSVNLSLTKACLNKVPNTTGCCPSSPSKKNPTTTSPP